MKIDFKRLDESRIGIVEGVPDGKSFKLIGLNGIGKTLTAKLLATISGTPVWEGQERVKSLSKYLKRFQVEITINETNFLIDTDVSKWVFDKLNATIATETLGSVYKDGYDSDFEELWKYFKCFIINGNESIDEQIHLLISILSYRISAYFENKQKLWKDFSDYSNKLHDYLNCNNKLDELIGEINLFEKEKEKKSKFKYDTLKFLDRLLDDLRLIDDFRDFNLKDPIRLPPFNNMITFFDKSIVEIETELSTIRGKISQFNNLLSGSQEKEIDRIENEITKVNNEINTLKSESPLDFSKYSTQDDINSRLSELGNKKLRLIESEKKMGEGRLRERLLSGFTTSSVILRDDYNLSSNPIILFEKGTRDEVSIEELIDWSEYSIEKTKTELKTSASISSIKAMIKQIENEEKKLNEHSSILRKFEFKKKKLDTLINQLGSIARNNDKIKALPRLKNRERKLNSKLTDYQIIKKQLDDVSPEIISTWDSFAKRSGFSITELRKSVSEDLNNQIQLQGYEKRIHKLKQICLEHLENKPLSIKLPKNLEKLIQEADFEKLKQLHDVLDQFMYPQRMEKIGEEAYNVINNLTNQETKLSSDWNDLINHSNSMIGEKLKNLLNRDEFKRFVFDGADILNIDAKEGKIIIRDDERETTRFISDYSSGEKAFAYSLSTILNIQSRSKKPNLNVLLFLDEFGSLLSIDRMDFLMDYLNSSQEKENWPNKYVLVFPFKGEKDYEEEIDEHGYAYVPIGEIP